ncbi:Arabinose operon regulatory protein [compost metagenome]
MKVYIRHLIKNALQYSAFAESSHSIIDKLLDYLDQHFNQDISRNDLAEIVFLNPDYISRLFKREVGMSIGSYLLDKRLETAKELLRNGSLPINAISMHVGYSNFSYFTKTFRESTGVTPNEYRKQCRA